LASPIASIPLGNELHLSALSGWTSVTMNPLPFHRHRVFRIEDSSIRSDEGVGAMLWTVVKEAAANWSSHKRFSPRRPSPIIRFSLWDPLLS
jgi:hypothetical protein